MFASAADLDTLSSIREKRDEVASERDRLAQKVQEITSERDRVAGLLVDGQAAQERLKEELQREVMAKEGAVKQAADAAQEKADLEVKVARLEKALEARSASLAQAEDALEKERSAALQFAREVDEAFERKSWLSFQPLVLFLFFGCFLIPPFLSPDRFPETQGYAERAVATHRAGQRGRREREEDAGWDMDDIALAVENRLIFLQRSVERLRTAG